MSLKNSNLLVISLRYPHPKAPRGSIFVKSQTDFLKNYVGTVYVISLTPFIPKFLSKFSFMHPRWRGDTFVYNYKYDNVEVYYAKHFTLPFSFSKKRRGDVAFEVVNKIIQKEKIEFDLIHAHHTYPSGYVGAKLKEIYGKPLIVTGHGYDVYDLPFKNAEWNKKIRSVLKMTDHIITPSKSNYDKLIQLKVLPKKISVIPNGYNSDLFLINKAKEKLNLQKDKKIILSVGYLDIAKGHKYLLKAMKEVVKHRKDVLCIIVGDGKLKNKLKSQIKEIELENYVILAGEKSHKEIPMWMNACDIFVLPSLSEGNPTVMFEALGCGRPFIGTNVGGIPEIITNEKLGILVEPKDVDGLAKAILKALDIKWDKNYILSYAKQFTWDKIAEKIVEVYYEVLKKK